MAFKKLQTNKKFIKLSEQTKGDVLAEGTYLGAVENKFGGTNHEFKTESGVVSISAGSLNYIMESNVNEGDKVQVEYDGQITLEKGNFKGKPCHQFNVYLDDEYTSNSAIPPKDTSKKSSNKAPSLNDLD